VTSEIEQWVREVGIPFFVNYSDMSIVLNTLRNDKLGTLLAPLNRTQIISAMEVAVGA
jgi:hypothetical protein